MAITKEGRERIRQKATGRRHSEATKNKLRADRTGIPLAPHVRAKMNAEKSKVVQCPHCGKIGKNGGMKKHHFRNCKNARNSP